MDDESLAGVLDVVDTEESALHERATPEQARETAKAEPKESKETKAEPAKKEAKEEADPADEEEEVTDTQDYSRNADDESDDEVEDSSDEPSQNESTEEEVESETADEDEFAPRFVPEPKFNLKQPEYDDQGYITNMTPQEYQQYMIGSAVHQMQYQQWVETNETRALEAAEKILPQMKSNQAVRTMVESIRLAGLQTGKDTNSYEAAKLVKEALGLSSKQVADKVAKAKAEGIQSAKTSIKVQKSAAVETKGSTKKKSDSGKDAQLAKRLKAGDDDAFAELFSQWDKDGKL